MKMRVDCNEKWPVFSLHDPSEAFNPAFSIDLSEEFIARFLAIQDEFEAMQAKLKEIYERCESKEMQRTHAADQKLWADLYEDSKRVHCSPPFTGRPSSSFTWNKIRPDAC